MSRIHRLPPDLANQIAAGEVVERPASVVKELVENALDAGARRITVAVELGGKKLIRVEDDGEGMEPEDARLALERHATSKIAHADDLARSGRSGFAARRCPASRRSRTSCFAPAPAALRAAPRFASTAGRSPPCAKSARPKGTSIEVADLFYNLPARRKFLKSDTAETTQISRLATPAGAGVSRGWIHADERRRARCSNVHRRPTWASGSFSCSATGRISSRFARRRAA